ncbi:XrtA/PEP-CTERM system exopolysaccharide export protein [Pelagibius sp. Alg239-R121]|uniref:XrtA/PEP-CTERM system exopolysaccharide export protein n=1 Tax=Pelagibius sp. Alg239-R121 TaxID=2993448 RepID=UPI0024A6705D|nr:XrtA/PEP-CTERM system exopolysaccharide export protein [Pelagibius sp. Alg239-R121]
MVLSPLGAKKVLTALVVGATLFLVGCSGDKGDLPAAKLGEESVAPMYRIGAGDNLNIFVWRNAELTISVPVRPDGRISVPLMEDLEAANKTPSELAREIEEKLAVFVQDPIVTIIVTGFVGPFTQQVRVLGEASQPRAIPYRANMTALDVMISVGGLTQFADGNDATIVRLVGDDQKEFRVRLDDLIKDGDITANVAILPGDVLIVPESVF